MSPLHHLALLLLIAVFLTGAFGAGPGSGCTVKSRSSAKVGAHAHASSEASAERGQPWGKRLFALLAFIYLELRYLLERHYCNRNDDKWGKWEGSL